MKKIILLLCACVVGYTATAQTPNDSEDRIAKK
jgi:hypothetical protein